MQITSAVLFNNDDTGAFLVVDSGSVELRRGRSETAVAALATVSSGSRYLLTGPTWVKPTGASADVHIERQTAVKSVVSLSQAAYDALAAPDERTLYVITG